MVSGHVEIVDFLNSSHFKAINFISFFQRVCWLCSRFALTRKEWWQLVEQTRSFVSRLANSLRDLYKHLQKLLRWENVYNIYSYLRIFLIYQINLHQTNGEDKSIVWSFIHLIILEWQLDVWTPIRFWYSLDSLE